MYKNIDNSIKPIGDPMIYLIQGKNIYAKRMQNEINAS